MNLEIVSFDPEDTAGRYHSTPHPIQKLIILNDSILKNPEYAIIHTIVHEIAHSVIGQGETKLYEKEAEELIVKWGFEEESKKVAYAKTWLESDGYAIGYEWASKQKDLSRFEDFYEDWNKDKLTAERLEELIYEADVTSILYEMGRMEEKPNYAATEISKNVFYDPDGSLDHGVIWGIMGFLKKKREDRMKRLDKPELSDSEKHELFWIKLQEALDGFDRLYDQEIWLLTHQYAKEYPEVCALMDAILQVETLIEERAKQEGGEP